MKTSKIATFAALCVFATACANGGHQEDAAQQKTFAVLGDSYSTFINAVSPDTNYVWYTPHEIEAGNTDVDSASQMWWSIMADSLNIKLLQNNSFSGATICNRGYNGDDYADRSFITRLSNLPQADMIFIFGGTNDSWAGAPAGSYDFETFSPDSLYTFRPAMALLLKTLREKQPQAQLFVLINSQLRNEISESMMAIADHYGACYVTLYDIDKRCGHPTRAGQRSIAIQTIKAIRKATART